MAFRKIILETRNDNVWVYHSNRYVNVNNLSLFPDRGLPIDPSFTTKQIIKDTPSKENKTYLLLSEFQKIPGNTQLQFDIEVETISITDCNNCVRIILI